MNRTGFSPFLRRQLTFEKCACILASPYPASKSQKNSKNGFIFSAQKMHFVFYYSLYISHLLFNICCFEIIIYNNNNVV